MDTRLKYGLGVFALGIGNFAYGLSLLLIESQLTVFVAVEIVLGFVMGVFGALVLNDPDRISQEELSPRLMNIIGWTGIVLGIGLLIYTAFYIINMA